MTPSVASVIRPVSYITDEKLVSVLVPIYYHAVIPDTKTVVRAIRETAKVVFREAGYVV